MNEVENLKRSILWSDAAFTQALWHIVNFRNPSLPYTLKRARISKERFELCCEIGGLSIADFLRLAKALDKAPDDLMGCVLGVLTREEHTAVREQAQARVKMKARERSAKEARRPRR